jgi:hypothetical protein
VASLAVVLGVTGIASGTVLSREGGDRLTVVAAGGVADPLAEPWATTTAVAVTAVPVPTVTTAPTTTMRATPAVPVPTTTSVGAPSGPTVPPTKPPGSSTTTTTASPGPEPSSWSMDANGISMRMRIEPAAPRVGDTIRIIIESWATVPTDFCCINHVYVNGEMIYSRFHDQGPCPLAPSPVRQETSYVMTAPGRLGIQLQANRVDLCVAPPRFTTNNLFGSVMVPPASS